MLSNCDIKKGKMMASRNSEPNRVQSRLCQNIPILRSSNAISCITRFKNRTPRQFTKHYRLPDFRIQKRGSANLKCWAINLELTMSWNTIHFTTICSNCGHEQYLHAHWVRLILATHSVWHQRGFNKRFSKSKPVQIIVQLQFVNKKQSFIPNNVACQCQFQ